MMLFLLFHSRVSSISTDNQDMLNGSHRPGEGEEGMERTVLPLRRLSPRWEGVTGTRRGVSRRVGRVFLSACADAPDTPVRLLRAMWDTLHLPDRNVWPTRTAAS